MTNIATKAQFTNLVLKLAPPGAPPTSGLGVNTWDEIASSFFSNLKDCYVNGSRKYHTLEHIGWGLARIDEMEMDDRTRGSKHVDRDWDLIRFAFWYHDAVMRGAGDDVHRSAAMASSAMDCIDPSASPTVARLVMATSHERIPRSMDAAVICDADLSILAASLETFDHYEELVREEWAHVPDNLFYAARYVILNRFAKRPWIYMTDYGRALWERPARVNLSRSMGALVE